MTVEGGISTGAATMNRTSVPGVGVSSVAGVESRLTPIQISAPAEVSSKGFDQPLAPRAQQNIDIWSMYGVPNKNGLITIKPQPSVAEIRQTASDFISIAKPDQVTAPKVELKGKYEHLIAQPASLDTFNRSESLKDLKVVARAKDQKIIDSVDEMPRTENGDNNMAEDLPDSEIRDQLTIASEMINNTSLTTKASIVSERDHLKTQYVEKYVIPFAKNETVKSTTAKEKSINTTGNNKTEPQDQEKIKFSASNAALEFNKDIEQALKVRAAVVALQESLMGEPLVQSELDELTLKVLSDKLKKTETDQAVIQAYEKSSEASIITENDQNVAGQTESEEIDTTEYLPENSPEKIADESLEPDITLEEELMSDSEGLPEEDVEITEYKYVRDEVADSVRRSYALAATDAIIQNGDSPALNGYAIANLMPSDIDQPSEIQSAIARGEDIQDGSYKEVRSDISRLGKLDTRGEVESKIESIIAAKPAVTIVEFRTTITEEVTDQDVQRVYNQTPRRISLAS